MKEKCKFGYTPGICKKYNCCFLNMDGSCSKDGNTDNQTAVLRTHLDNSQIVTSQPFSDRIIKKSSSNIRNNDFIELEEAQAV